MNHARGKRQGQVDWLGCRTDKSHPISNWERECNTKGEDGFDLGEKPPEVATAAFLGGTTWVAGKPSANCIGSSRQIRTDCPMWSEWSLNINVCGTNAAGAAPKLQKPHCNEDDHYYDYRYCRMGGKAHGLNPRNKEDFENGATQASVYPDPVTLASTTAFDYPNNVHCRVDSTITLGVVNEAGDIRARKSVLCGVTMEEFFTCHDEDQWRDLEIERWILIAVAIAGLVILHAIIPIHFIPFFG